MAVDFDLIIFGGTGDLSMRKLLPALYRAEVEGSLGAGARVFLTSRAPCEGDRFLDDVSQGLARHLSAGEFIPRRWESFRHRLQLLAMDAGELDERWDALVAALSERPGIPRIFYLAVPPQVFGDACAHLAAKGLIAANSRVVLEKPIGYDLDSALRINARVGEFFREEQIYRIDHYLGKETVQNLLALRFSNALFEELWDARNIHHVQITLAETVGVEGRASFYDKAGATRDMVQNHLLQLLSLVTMEPPNNMAAASIRAEKLKVLQALRPLTGAAVSRQTVRGQYTAGVVSGRPVPGYLDELGVDSDTETFVALCAHVDTWRWARVPFLLRTGKRLKERYAEIVIQFRSVSHEVFPTGTGALQPNRLVIRLQPEESIKLTLMAKVMNRPDMHLKPVTLNLNLSEGQAGSSRSDAYKSLLLDAAAGNPSLFIHRDEVEAAWRWVDPIFEAWQSQALRPLPYAAGSWGPEAADQLPREAGCQWYQVEEQG